MAGDHVHMIWANSSEGSSSQSETPSIMHHMRFLNADSFHFSATFSPFMRAQNSSSSSANSQEVMRLQQQQPQFLHDFHVNFYGNPQGLAGIQALHAAPPRPQGSQFNPPDMIGAYPAPEIEARRAMEGNQRPNLPTQPCPAQLQPSSSTGPSSEAADQGRPSKGSAGHDKGNCRPCHYFHSRTGCANGDQCSFCHLKHPKRSRVRIPKQYRQQCRALAQLVYDAQGCDKEIRKEMELQLLIQTSFDHRLTAYATSVLKSLRGGAVLQDFPQGLALSAGDQATPAAS